LQLIKTKDVFHFTNIILISLPLFGVLLYEMLMEIRIEAFDLVPLSIGLGLMKGIGIGGDDGARASGSLLLRHFFQMRVPIRKNASAIRIIMAGEVKVQWATASAAWWYCLNSWLLSNLPLYLVLSPWIRHELSK
jgi:hypothetical protein